MLEAISLEGRQQKLQSLSVEEVGANIEELQTTNTYMKSVLFTKQDMVYIIEKVAALSKAGTLLNDSKDVLVDAQKLVTRSAIGDAASVAQASRPSR